MRRESGERVRNIQMKEREKGIKSFTLHKTQGVVTNSPVFKEIWLAECTLKFKVQLESGKKGFTDPRRPA